MYFNLDVLYAALLPHMHITLYTDQQQLAGYICFIPTFNFHLQRQNIKFNNAPCCLSDDTSFYILREHSCHNTITQSQGTPHFTCQSARSGKTSSAPVHRANGSRKLCVLLETCSHFQRFHPIWSILIAYLGNNSLPVSLQLWPAEWRSGAVAQTQRGLPETKPRNRFSYWQQANQGRWGTDSTTQWHMRSRVGRVEAIQRVLLSLIKLY